MQETPTLNEVDFTAADAVLKRLRADAMPGRSRDDLRQSYASLHARFGADTFALRFGLRQPRTPLEELEFLFFSQQITEDEYKRRFKEYATRPVDELMLKQFFGEYESAVAEYSHVLQLIVEIATNQHDPDCWQRREHEVDAAVKKLDAKFDLFSAELLTVSEYLTTVQVDREEPVKCGDYTGDSAHWIASLVFSHTSKAWTKCEEVAGRSRTDPRYAYPASASSLFFTSWIESKKLPKPNDLAALLRGERAKAFAKFNSSTSHPGPAANKLAKTVQPVHFEDFSGHQFERLVFAYRLRTDKWRTLEWYGQSGSDLGRDIWGEREAGGSLCIQCVNRKTTAAKKITGDLDKIVGARCGIPTTMLVVCASSVSATLRDKVKDHAQKKGISQIHIWSGHEFEERLRRDAESLLRRFVEGELFPDDANHLRQFSRSTTVSDDAVSRPAQ